MHFTHNVIISLAAGILSPALAKPVTFDVKITLNDDGSATTTTSSGGGAGTVNEMVSSQYDTVFCNGTNYNETLLDKYVCGDKRLGPKTLPREAPPLGSLLSSYSQLGGYSPGAFLETWWNATGEKWLWPPQDGFTPDDDTDMAIKNDYELVVGVYVDRFGYEGGKFLAPFETAYVQRALPPDSLDTPQDNPSIPYNYRVYKVEKPFTVLSGSIAPWFGQMGQGTQYQTSQNISVLLQQGFLREVMSGNTTSDN